MDRYYFKVLPMHCHPCHCHSCPSWLSVMVFGLHFKIPSIPLPWLCLWSITTLLWSSLWITSTSSPWHMSIIILNEVAWWDKEVQIGEQQRLVWAYFTIYNIEIRMCQCSEASGCLSRERSNYLRVSGPVLKFSYLGRHWVVAEIRLNGLNPI